jgi:hypothetical protein
MSDIYFTVETYLERGCPPDALGFGVYELDAARHDRGTRPKSEMKERVVASILLRVSSSFFKLLSYGDNSFITFYVLFTNIFQ